MMNSTTYKGSVPLPGALFTKKRYNTMVRFDIMSRTRLESAFIDCIKELYRAFGTDLFNHGVTPRHPGDSGCLHRAGQQGLVWPANQGGFAVR